MSESKLPSPETVSALLILMTVFHVLALILTSFRLWFRYHIRRLWWDDFWAALALICDAVCMVAGWTLTAPLDNPYVNIEALPTAAQSRRVHIISYWLSILFYTCTIWFARFSIAFSVLRVVPPTRSVMSAYGACVVLACMWAYIFTSKAVACAVDKSWYDAIAIQCPVPNWVALSEVCTDILSDAILVALPFRFLWRIKMPANQRTMLLSVFSASILVSVVSAVHTAYLIPTASFIGGATAEIEGAVSLIVCNLLVIVTFVYRTFRNDQDLTGGVSDKNTRSSNRLTTVDLDVSGGSLFTTMQTTGSGTTGTYASSLKFASMSDGETTFGTVTATTGDHARGTVADVSAGDATPRTRAWGRGRWGCF